MCKKPISFGSCVLQRGFSMLEILITLVIVAIALLGTAGLQVYAMRMGHGGQLRTQAVFLASDIAERMEANKVAAVAGNYAVAAASSPSAAAADCGAVPCSGAALAGYDISQWENSIANLLPQARWQVTQLAAGNPSTYSIFIQWTDRSADKTSRGETFSYTATRTVSN
ncbi:MAG: type IV pilus assembly protein PilV [Gallionellaceae bacterium]|nr:MAG: type IV pilus assembly protein PilV [Gallionellaceae bacterium]